MEDKFKLTTIEIKGYKSIAFGCPLTLELSDINVLIGANGVGKSNIVSFFKMLGYMMSGSFQLFVELSGTSDTFLHYGAKHTPVIEGKLRFENRNNVNTYSFTLTNALDRLIISTESIARLRKLDNRLFKVKLLPDFKESALITANEKYNKTVKIILSGCKVYQFNDSSVAGPLRKASHIDSAHYLQSEGNNLAAFLYYLKDNYVESYRRIVDYVRMVVPQFDNFYLEPNKDFVSLKWTDTSLNDYVFSSYQLSDGAIRFIALATLLLQPEQTMPSVIIIDEPELGLHPYAIGQLIEMVHDASLHAQIILATQSPTLIDGFDADCITVLDRDDDSQCSYARKLSSEELGDWLKEYSLSELWDKNIIGGRPL